MFHTFPQAERWLPPVLAPNGQRAWEWVELTFPRMTHLMVTLSWCDREDDWLSRRFLFVRIAEALEFLRQHEKQMDKVRLDALRTAEDGESPEVHPIREVWSDGDHFVFVTAAHDKLVEPPHGLLREEALFLAWAAVENTPSQQINC